MSGTREGGLKAHAKVLERYGEDFVKAYGRRGGLKKVPKGFAKMKKEDLREISAKGGRISKRPRAL